MTNIDLLGSELDYKIKEASAKSELIWVNIDMNQTGLYIWHARNFKLEQIKKENIGMFYEGDSYIVFNIQKKPDNTLSYNIHFWLGNATTQDEMGTVAYKTVELDTYLHGKAIQYRETQGNESDLFRSYFPNITYKLGGVESGFKKVQAYDYSNYKSLLYRIKNTSSLCVPCILSSITEDDTFVLDNGLEIFIYFGKNATYIEQLMAEYLANNIQDNRKGCSMKNVSNLETFQSLIKSYDVKVEETSKLYRITDNKTEMISGPITKQSFDTNDAFLFCTAYTTFIWIGKNSSYNELLYAWKIAFKITGPTSAISLVKEGSEPEVFWMALN